MLGTTKGKILNQYIENYVVYDLETTGLSSIHDEVIEVAAVKVRKGKVVDGFNELVNPGRSIPYAASRVNHITDAMVAQAPMFKEVLSQFIQFVGDDILVGHNIHTFDMKFIYRDCEKYFEQTITNDYVDTLRLAKQCFPDWRHRGLGDLASYYGIATTGAHRALADCMMNQQVYEMLGRELSHRNGRKVCPVCGQPLKKRNGRYGEFLGCMGFPRCRYTEKL